jgi:S-adenosylmethionine decarboxylase
LLSVRMSEQLGPTTGDVTHLMIVARECAGPVDDVQALTMACVDTVNEVGLQVVAETTFAFTPHGATIVLLLAQSHLVVSTWPEHRLVIVDVTICGSKTAAAQLWRGIGTLLEPGSSEISECWISLANTG